MRAASRHVRAILFFATVGVVSGCVGSDAPTTGALSVNLVGRAESGNTYRLRDAIITVKRPGYTRVFNTEDDPNRTSLSDSVAVGDYSALLQDGFRLERVDGSSTTTVEAELISDNPALFTVFTQQRTTVPLRFRVNAEDVDLTQGYDIVLEVDEVTEPQLVITNFLSDTPGIEVFSADARGDTAPLRAINGPATRLLAPRGVTVAGGEIIVVDHNANAVNFYPVRASGDIAPTRQIAGLATGLSTPSGILVFGGEIYVVQQSGTIVVFPRSASGDVVPARTISGIGRGQYIAIDEGEIYATDVIAGVIRVFPVTTDGQAVPTRVIGGVVAGLSLPTGILVQNGEIFVADRSGQIRVFAKTADGDAAPRRVLNTGLSSFSSINQMAIFAGELYVTSFTTNAVGVFPVDGNGEVFPNRVIAGPTTLLSGPVGAFVF